MNRTVALVHMALLALCWTPVAGQSARDIIAESQKRSRADTQRYEGTLEVQDPKRKVASKRWTYQRLGSAGESKAVLRFTAPAEVKGVALLVFNHPDRASDQWLWTPSTQRDRRISFQDRRTRFFGTDFTFEDLEERDVEKSSYKLLGEENIDGALCWKIEATPKPEARSQYSRSIIWVRKDYYVPAQAESFEGDTLRRRLHYRDFERVQNIWTARTLEMNDLKQGSKTILKLEKLQYNMPLSADDFTLQALRRES